MFQNNLTLLMSVLAKTTAENRLKNKTKQNTQANEKFKTETFPHFDVHSVLSIILYKSRLLRLQITTYQKETHNKIFMLVIDTITLQHFISFMHVWQN